MAYRSYDSPLGALHVTPWVKRLLIANVAVFVAYLLLNAFGGGLGTALSWRYLGLDRSTVLVQPWTLLTYAFVHASVGHIFFNMLALFFFGPPLEERWGSTPFLKFYLVAAAGGAIVALFSRDPVVGASAAVNGVMLGYAMTWPDNQVYVWGIFPIKVKWLVAILAAVSFLFALDGGGGPVSHLAHLGGFASAFLYLKSPWAPNAWGEVLPVKRKKRAMAWRAGPKLVDTPARPAAQQPIGRTQAAHMERDLLDDVDRILDKISTEGLASLTPQERDRLNEVSRQKRTN
ncbi:MAG: Peptidase rhomboid domain protein [Gemmatimonadetes bacterium]|nr:Peptidase rhomboid domain protein [Gemmatimonadota bacterium]